MLQVIQTSNDLITVGVEEECDVLDKGYMRAEQDVTEHPLGVQVNESYYSVKPRIGRSKVAVRK